MQSIHSWHLGEECDHVEADKNISGVDEVSEFIIW